MTTTILAVACAVLYVCGAKATYDSVRHGYDFEGEERDPDFHALVIVFWFIGVIYYTIMEWRDRP